VVIHETEVGASVPSLEHRPVWRSVFHQWWLIAILALVGGLAGLFIGSTIEPVYEAEALVQANVTNIVIEGFDHGQTLFSSDEVLQPVVDALNLDTTPKALLGKGQLDSQAVTGGLLQVIGRAEDPDLAVDLANEAAQSFQLQMVINGLGDFRVLTANDASTVPAPSELVTLLAGGLVGAMIGIGVLLLLFFVRQPLLTEKEALAEFPADIAFSVRVRAPSRFPFLRNPFRRKRTERTIVYPGGVIGAIWRSAHSGGQPSQTPLACVLAERHRRGDRTVRALLSEMRVVDEWGRQADESKVASLYWIQSSAGTLAEALEPVGVVVTLVSEGAPRRLLRELAEELLVAPEQKRWTLVFVRPARRRLRSTGLASGSAGGWPLAGLSHSPQPESQQTPARST
jgi:capsular polysaccharide biosynthesis protein